MNTSKLRPNEFIDHAPKNRGEQIYYYHQSCPAVTGGGADHKPRLAIKRTEDGYTILAHCHHCGQSGSYRETHIRHNKIKDGSGTRHSSSRGSLPRTTQYDPTSWPSEARSWLYKARINDEEIKRRGIGYEPERRQIILPIYKDGKLSGYQERRVFSDDIRPKYVTRRFDNELFWCHNKGRDQVVLVEDILSAIRISTVMDSVALLGTSLKDFILSYLINNNYKEVYIWLDNNNPQVKSNQLKIKRKLVNFFDSVHLILTDKDPKEYSDTQIRDVLKNTT